MIKTFLLALSGILFLCAIDVSAQANFANNAGISLTDSSGGSAAQGANPYPSTVAVSGLTANITKITVTLRGLTGTFQDDNGFLLVGPTGVKVRLMSDCGGNNAGAVTLTFDDAAAAPPNCGAVLVSGTYKPTAGNSSSITGGAAHPANFPSPAPTSPYSLLLSDFNGTNPNGTWSLYADDDTASGAGSLAGWSVTITAGNPTAAPATIEGRVTTANGRGISKAVVNLLNANTNENKIILTNPFGYFRFAGLPTGSFYIISITDKRYRFSDPATPIQLLENTQINFTAEPKSDSIPK